MDRRGYGKYRDGETMKRHRMKKSSKKRRMKRDSDYGIGKGIGRTFTGIMPAIGLGVGLSAGASVMGEMGNIGSAAAKLKV